MSNDDTKNTSYYSINKRSHYRENNNNNNYNNIKLSYRPVHSSKLNVWPISKGVMRVRTDRDKSEPHWRTLTCVAIVEVRMLLVVSKTYGICHKT